MQGTLDGFSYGAVTPVVAFVMACLGGALGLRCTTRSVRNTASFKPGWLALGAAAIGVGIWSMHFVAMMGFTVAEAPITYDRPITYASLAVAIVMVGIGVFIVGYRGATLMALGTGGTIMGLGVASMHYLGMAGMRFQGRVDYSTPIVVLSVVIAVVAATAALWAAVSIHGFLASLGASLVMGVAVTGMHYTGMASVSVHLHGAPGTAGLGEAPTALLAPMLLGPVVFLLLAAVVVMFDPLLVMGDADWQKPTRRTPLQPGIPARSTLSEFPARTARSGFPSRPVQPTADSFESGFPSRPVQPTADSFESGFPSRPVQATADSLQPGFPPPSPQPTAGFPPRPVQPDFPNPAAEPFPAARSGFPDPTSQPGFPDPTARPTPPAQPFQSGIPTQPSGPPPVGPQSAGPSPDGPTHREPPRADGW